ncbi:MAG: hypothetical protein EXR50_08790 [Dehalococcoidia bacterium]|nr:hypothetical protein [Dehalococcoidia bacterium]
MDKAEIKRLIDELASDSKFSGKELLLLLEEQLRSVPISLRMLERRPDILAPQTMKILAQGGALDPKIKDLVAIAAAAALRNDALLKEHMEAAFSHGASSDEIFETLIIAGLVSESATNEVSLRVFQQVEGIQNTNERWGKKS